MAKKQINIRASDLTIRQIEQLMEWWGTSQTETLTLIIDRAHEMEKRRRKLKGIEDGNKTLP